MEKKCQNPQQQEIIMQKLVRHIEKRQKIRQLYADKGIQMLDKQDQLFQDIQDPVLRPSQNNIYNSMQNELSQQGYSEFRYLGQGAQGFVVLAKNQLSNKRFAIKGILIKDSKGNVDQEAIKQANQEIDMLNKCKGSPFVVNFIGQILGKEYIYLVLTECLGTLSQIIEMNPDEKLNELSAIKYAKDIAEGLHFIHSRKCLVNDLKMDNILIDYNGNAVVSDFGFADNLQTQSGYAMRQSMGNIAFQAPECYDPRKFNLYSQEYQRLGIAVKREPSQRSEACSLGYLIYTMISGFNYEMMFNKHQPLDFLPEFQNFNYKNLLQYIIHGLTQFEPIKRFTIKDVLIILKGIISFEFQLDRKFVELIDAEDEAVQQFIQPFNTEVELIQHLENKFYPIIQSEKSLLQKLKTEIISSKKQEQDAFIEGLNQQIKNKNDTIINLQKELEQIKNSQQNNQIFVQNKQDSSSQVFNQQEPIKPSKQEQQKKAEIPQIWLNQISSQKDQQQEIQSNWKWKKGYLVDDFDFYYQDDSYSYFYYYSVCDEKKEFIGLIKMMDYYKGKENHYQNMTLWENWNKEIGEVSLINGKELIKYKYWRLSLEENLKLLTEFNCEFIITSESNEYSFF